MRSAHNKKGHYAYHSTADFKNGLGLRIKDKVYTIVEFQHVKPGKGGAFVRYKTRDIKSGRVVENTCNAGTKFESVMLTTREFQYLYNDGTDYIFMDNESYEQVPVPEDMVGENSKWLRENDICQLLFADDELMGVTPPMFIETTIVQTDPGFKGDTVQVPPSRPRLTPALSSRSPCTSTRARSSRLTPATASSSPASSNQLF